MTGIFGVHISDGVLADTWIVSGFLVAGLLIAFSLYRLREEEIPRISLLTAAFFVASLIHVKVIGTSVHLLLNGLMGVLLGRRAVLAITVGLAMQFFLFAHGGLSTLGVNIVVMAIPALLAAAGFPILCRVLPAYAAGLGLGLATAALTVIGNFVVLWLGGKEDWQRLAQLILLAHLPIIAIEGLIVGFIVQYLAKVRPDLLPSTQGLSLRKS